MKKILRLVIFVALVAGINCLIACSQEEAKDVNEDHVLKVVTTFTVIQDMAQNVAGDVALVESITKAGAEIHDYAPTPKDIAKAQSADLVLWNGLNLERWFERFYDNVDGVPSVVVTDGIEPLSIYDGPYKDMPNPHAWMSAENAVVYVTNIKNAFVEHDPKNKETYEKNAAAYIEEIKTMAAPLKAEISAIPEEKRWLVTSEGAFSYLAKDLGLKELYLWPVNADGEGTPQQVRRVVDKVKAEKIPVVFSESTVSDKPAKEVAAESGAAYGGVLYVDSLSTEDGPVPTYLDLLRVTVNTVVTGFKDAE